MRRPLLPSLLIAILCSATSFAAIEYRYREVTRTDMENLASSDVTATAVIQGDKSRVDFVSGSMYGPGTYVISMNGSRNMLVINPVKQTYAEVNLSQIASAVGASNIVIANAKTNVRKLDDHPVIAGYPTDHWIVESSYEMTVTFGSIPLKQTVRTVIEKWTTTAFGDVGSLLFDAGPLQTGKPELDQLIASETVQIKGLPLKQVVVITTTLNEKIRARSPIKVPSSRRQTSEMLVTSVKNIAVDDSFFQVPRHFKPFRAGTVPPEQKDPIHILNMEPATDN